MVRRKSLMAVNIAVVNIRDSIDKLGLSRSKQNSSISSNKMTHRRNDCNLSKTYRIRDATLDNPSFKNIDVSITTKSQPLQKIYLVQTDNMEIKGSRMSDT